MALPTVFGNKNLWLVCFSSATRFAIPPKTSINRPKQMRRQLCSGNKQQAVQVWDCWEKEVWRDGPSFLLGTLSCSNTRKTSLNGAAGRQRPDFWAQGFTVGPWSRARPHIHPGVHTGWGSMRSREIT